MIIEGGDQWLQLRKQLLTTSSRKCPDHSDTGELTGVFVKPQQQGPNAVRAALVHPIAGDDTVGSALVLDLEHGALVRLVRASQRLGHHPVKASALELGEPLDREVMITGGWRD